MHIRVARLPASPLSVRFGGVVRVGRFRASMWTCSGKRVPSRRYERMELGPLVPLQMISAMVFISV